MGKTYHWGREEFITHLGPGERKIHLHKKCMPRSTLRGCPGTSNDWTGAVIRFSSHGKMTNEIQIYFSITSHTKTKNEIQIRFSKWCENEKRNSNPFFKVMRERKTKFKSVFKVMRKWKTKLKRNSLPFFKVVRKRKTKYEVQIRFSMSCEKEKWKWNWIPFSHAIEKRLAIRYTNSQSVTPSKSMIYSFHTQTASKLEPASFSFTSSCIYFNQFFRLA